MKKNKLNLKKKFSQDFEIGLKKIGIKNTKNLFVTSNLKSISKIRLPKNDKLNLLLNSLKKIMGKNYTIFTPTATLNLCNTNFAFDVNKTPSFQMGPFSEFIRLQKNSLRSMHPFWSVSAIGKNKNCLRNVSKHSYAYGSPWSKMLSLDTTQLNLGIHPSKAVTLIHHIETIAGVPYRFNKEFKCKIINKSKESMKNFICLFFLIIKILKKE